MSALQQNWPIGRIIEVANELLSNGSSAGSTSEIIAAAFVLDRMAFIPHGFDVLEAWDRLDNWQRHVYRIKRDHMHQLVPW